MGYLINVGHKISTMGKIILLTTTKKKPTINSLKIALTCPKARKEAYGVS